jgi:hypothetical protein
MRPVQMRYLAALYSVFGLNPLRYHLVNAAVFSAGIVLFYLTLRELQIPALFATSVALVYFHIIQRNLPLHSWCALTIWYNKIDFPTCSTGEYLRNQA